MLDADQKMHPCGVPMSRMQWPFKTQEELKLIAKYMRKVIRQAQAKAHRELINNLPEAKV